MFAIKGEEQTPNPESMEQNGKFAKTATMLIAIAGLIVASMFYAHVDSLPTRALLGGYPDGKHSVFSDDALFYDVIAKNIVNGKGSTFDGEAFTNGYHPAWMLLHLPLAALAGDDPELHTRRSLQLSFLMHVLASVLLAFAISYFSSPFFSVSCGIFHFISQPALENAVSGTEASLAGLSTGLCLWSLMLFLKRLHNDSELESNRMFKRKTDRLALLLGLFLGIHFLARTDGVFLILSALTLVLISSFGKRQTEKPKSLSARLLSSRLHLLVFAIALITVPWLLFCLYKTGSIMQNSGLIKQLWRESMLVGKPIGENFSLGISLFYRYVFEVATIIPFGQLLFPVIFFFTLVCTVCQRLRKKTNRCVDANSVLVSDKREKRHDFSRHALFAGLAGLMAVGCTGIFYAIKFPHLRHWY